MVQKMISKVGFQNQIRSYLGFLDLYLENFLKSTDGSYRIVVEHESKETFVKMHNSPEHEKVHPAGHAFMSGPPQRKTYTVAAE